MTLAVRILCAGRLWVYYDVFSPSVIRFRSFHTVIIRETKCFQTSGAITAFFAFFAFIRVTHSEKICDQFNNQILAAPKSPISLRQYWKCYCRFGLPLVIRTISRKVEKDEPRTSHPVMLELMIASSDQIKIKNRQQLQQQQSIIGSSHKKECRPCPH